MPTVTIRDQTLGGTHPKTIHELSLDLLAERITVRELIRSRVYQEVQDYNLRRRRSANELFRGLVQPAKSPEPRDIDWKQQFDAAIRAFEHNGFFLLIGDHQP